jgi:uncharacterized phage protein (TIGR01671 family)
MNLKKQTQTRQIKFRAWNPDDKRIEYPLVFAICSNGKLQPLIKCSDGNRAYKDYPIMQYTGLTDKNGKEIYEGDIIQWTSSNVFSLGEIRKVQINYVEAQYWGQGRNLGVYLAELLANEKCEVIGNVFENPELLQE